MKLYSLFIKTLTIKEGDSNIEAGLDRDLTHSPNVQDMQTPGSQHLEEEGRDRIRNSLQMQNTLSQMKI